MLIAYGAHDRSDGQAVEVIIDEDQHAQRDRRQLRADIRFDVLGSPAAKRGGAACAVQNANQNAENYQEYQYADVVGIRKHGYDAAGEHVIQRAFKAEVGIQKAAHHDTDEQRGINFLCNQRQTDGDDGRQQRPKRLIEPADGRFRRFLGSFFIRRFFINSFDSCRIDGCYVGFRCGFRGCDHAGQRDQQKHKYCQNPFHLRTPLNPKIENVKHEPAS